MKRFFILMLTAVFAALMFPAPAFAQTLSNGVFCWEVSGGTATITSYKGTGKTVTIPDKLSNVPVTKIAAHMFKNHTEITSVTIADTVTELGEYAFYGCENLTSVKLSANLRCLNFGTFENCASLTGITLPAGLKEIGGSVFRNCRALTDVKLPSGLTVLGEKAFYNCRALQQIAVPGSVTVINDELFADCISLNTITLNTGTSKINAYSAMYSPFYNCAALTALYIPDTVNTIAAGAFAALNRNTVVYCGNSSAAYAEAAKRGLKTAPLPQPSEKPQVSSTPQPSASRAPQTSTNPPQASANPTQTPVNPPQASASKPPQASASPAPQAPANPSQAPAQSTANLTVSRKKLSGAPSGVKKTALTVAYASISWRGVTGVSGYDIYRSQNGGKYALINSVSGQEYTDYNLAPATKYSYKIRAYQINGSTITYSRDSKALKLTTPAGTPKAPDGLTSAATGYNSVTVTFSAVPGAKGYEVQRSDDGINFDAIKTLRGVKFTDGKLTPGVKYYYRVRAFNTSGADKFYGDYSGITSATPVLSVPAKIKVSALKNGAVKLKWGAVKGANGYEIRRAGGTGEFKAVWQGKGTSFTDNTAVPGATYIIRAYRVVNGKICYGEFSDGTAAYR